MRRDHLDCDQGKAQRAAAGLEAYLWMYPLYGLIAPLYEPVHNALRAWPWPLRGVIYVLGFWAMEYLTGWLLKRVIGACPWDYSRARWHVHGCIRLGYGPVWFLVGLGLESVHDLLMQLTPAIQQALMPLRLHADAAGGR